MPTILPVPGMALATEPAWMWPHIIETPLRGSTRRDSTSWVAVARVPSAPTMSWVRCGREVWPPVPVRVMVDLAHRRGDRADLERDLAGVGPRVAVQRVDLAQVLQHAAVDGVHRTAGAGLLGGLEDQPYAAGQQVLVTQPGQHQSDAEHDRGVHVVPAGVADAGHRRGVVDGLGVWDGQRVDVGAQADQSGGVVEPRRAARRSRRRCRSAAPWRPALRARGCPRSAPSCGARGCRPRGARGCRGGSPRDGP